MIFENEITKKYGMTITKLDYGNKWPDVLWNCDKQMGESCYNTVYPTPEGCVTHMLDLLLTECNHRHTKKCCWCKFFQYQFCTNQDRITELREKYGIIPPLKVDPDYCCDKFEVE